VVPRAWRGDDWVPIDHLYLIIRVSSARLIYFLPQKCIQVKFAPLFIRLRSFSSRRMDSFFENRDFFANRIQLETSSKSAQTVETLDILADARDTAVCVHIRPLTEQEVEKNHIQGVVRDNFGAQYL